MTSAVTVCTDTLKESTQLLVRCIQEYSITAVVKLILVHQAFKHIAHVLNYVRDYVTVKLETLTSGNFDEFGELG